MTACETLRVQYLEQLASRLRQTSKSAPHIGTQVIMIQPVRGSRTPQQRAESSKWPSFLDYLCPQLFAAMQEFVDCCDTILPFFDHLGPVFHVARGEFQQKLESLKQQVQEKPLLTDIVDADRRANRATVSPDTHCLGKLHPRTLDSTSQESEAGWQCCSTV